MDLSDDEVAAACRSRSPRSRSTNRGTTATWSKSWPARVVGERPAGMVGLGTRCRQPATVDRSCWSSSRERLIVAHEGASWPNSHSGSTSGMGTCLGSAASWWGPVFGLASGLLIGLRSRDRPMGWRE